MKKYNVTKYGLCGDGKFNNSEPLSALLENLPDDSMLFFPEGTYLFSQVVKFENKKKLSIVGENATLMTHFESCGDPANNNNLFSFENCEDICLSDFIITTDDIIGWSGVVTNVNVDELYYDVRIYDQFHVTGFEHPIALNTCDKDGSPDYMFDDPVWQPTGNVTVNGVEGLRYGAHAYEVIGDHLCRFKARSAETLSKLCVGEQVCYRFITYGNCHLGFKATKRVLIKNVDMYRAPSMCIVIGGRSEDFTLDHFTVKPAPGSRELYSANCDGIHIYSLGGYFKMRHCEFVGLGDDSLNVHSMPASVIKKLDGDKFEIMQPVFDYDNFGAVKYNPLVNEWGQKGDILEIYDTETFEQKGTIMVQSLDDGVLTYSKLEGSFEEGNILINNSVCPSVHISDCTVKNTRARAFLIRTRNVLIENCYMYGLSLPAILITPDIVRWYEVGNSRDITVRNNVIEKCAFIKSPANRGAIAVKSCDDDWNNLDYASYVHKNIRILDNKFINVGNSAVFISATDGVEISGNNFENCSSRRFSPTAYGIRHDVVTYNCNDVTVKDNVSTQKESRVFWAKKCKNVKVLKGE